VYRSRDGIRVRCRGRSPDLNEAVVILSGREYPQAFLQVPPEATVLDLGANIGLFSLKLLQLNRGRNVQVHAFEPYKPNFELMIENLCMNAITSVEANCTAVSDVDGIVVLDVGRSFDSIRIDPSDEAVATEEVRSVRVESYCQDRGLDRIDLMKMDVEGAEHAILADGIDWISAHVDRLIVECHDGPGVGRDSVVAHVTKDFEIDPSLAPHSPGVIFATRR
jgi:FkbM family methyltransferase